MLEISVTSYKYRNAKTKPCMKDTLNNANRTYAETYLTVDVVYRERENGSSLTFITCQWLKQEMQIYNVAQNKSNIILLYSNQYANT